MGKENIYSFKPALHQKYHSEIMDFTQDVIGNGDFGSTTNGESQNGSSEANGNGTATANNEVPKGTDDNVAEDRKLFVGGLSWETREPQLKEYFEKYGEVESVNLKLNPQTKVSLFCIYCFQGVILGQ